ncbi:MAG: energy transducer TonB [Methylophaga sp.]|nr:energy transducer TonB [Methylophaga sp.]
MAKTTASDRLLFTLTFSVILHLILVLGVSFNVFSPPTNTPVNQLEITLVQQKTEVAPEEAHFLAQATSEGGGETDQRSPEPTPDLPVPIAEDRPTSALTEISPEPIPEPEPEPEVTPEPEPVAEQIVEPLPESEVEQVEPTEAAEQIIETPAEIQQPVETVTQETAERQVEQAQATDVTEVQEEVEVVETVEPVSRPSAAELMARARNEISTLQSDLDASTRALSERPRKRRISAATQEYAAAAYMRAWEMKVERIGNLNYPQEARQQGINGSLMLSVDIKPDGSVPEDGIVVSRSSGHEILDQAAIRIVRLGAPYAEVPESVLQGNDMLTIIRTWRFESQRGLMAR